MNRINPKHRVTDLTVELSALRRVSSPGRLREFLSALFLDERPHARQRGSDLG